MIFLSVSAQARPWSFKAFSQRKVHLSAAHESSILLLMDWSCFNNKSLDHLRKIGFSLERLPSQHMEIEALNVRYMHKTSTQELEKLLSSEPCIKGLATNPTVYATSTNDPLVPDQAAWLVTKQEEAERLFFHPLFGIHQEVTIGVVDSGVQADHPDLSSRMWRAPDGTFGYDFVNSDSDPSDDYGHGTHVAGLIAAQRDNGVGIRGVMGAWSKIMALKTQNSSGGGTMADVVNAVRWAVDHNAEVVNLSLTSRLENTALEDVLQYAISKNVTVVVASGNNGEQITSNNFFSPIGYASTLNGVIGVGSIDASSQLKSSFSNYGSDFVEIAAPGADGQSGILSTFYGSSYLKISGTSMSSPQVAGAAALVIGFMKTHSLSVTPSLVEDSILNSADSKSENSAYFSGGRVLNLENLGRYIFNSTVIDSGGGFNDL